LIVDPVRHARVKEIFLAVCERDPAQWAEFLDDACGDDASLRGEVEELLARHTGAAGGVAADLHTALVDEDVEPLDFLPDGYVLDGKYRVEEMIGAGGMGRVYRATQLAFGRSVAVKVISGKLGPSSLAVQRFEREVAAIGRLNHPNIVTVYDAGADPSAGAYLVMELLDGRSLADEIAARGRIELGEAIDLELQICSAVEAAHTAGVIHRDLTPRNLMTVRRGGRPGVKVLDFGIAKLVDEEGQRLTPRGSIVGTPAHMAPEQIRGRLPDARTDIWGLGVLLYEMVSGALPFGGGSTAEVLAGILERDPEPLGRVIEGVPDELARVVERTLRKRPEERIQSAGELARELEQFRSE
jgi:eukaryotic-like serine/threonine-protein kinase